MQAKINTVFAARCLAMFYFRDTLTTPSPVFAPVVICSLLLRRGFVGDELTTSIRSTHGLRETVYVDGFGRIHFGSLPLTSLSFDATTLNSRLIFLFFFIKSDMKIINLCVADSSMISVEGLCDDHLRTSLYYNFTKIE